MSLTINALSKRYGNKWAFRDVSFEVEGGSVIGIFGGTGSGKSSLLKTIAGIGKLSGGSVFVDDVDLSTIKVKDRPVTYVGDRTPSLLNSVLAGLQVSAGSLSTGEDQLRAFDEAIAASRKVILLDDPFSRIDRSMRTRCFASVRKIGKMKGKVVIFASSDFGQIFELADEAAFLRSGAIIQTGSPQALYDEPETAELAILTGENNMIKARRITAAGASLAEFQTIDGGHRLFAESVGGRKPGPIDQDLVLAIRPEQIVVTAGAAPPEENFLRAKVKAIEPRGSTALIRFDAGDLELRTVVFKAAGLSVGDDCMLGLPPHRIRILSD